jgi:hypothetical protein
MPPHVVSPHDVNTPVVPTAQRCAQHTWGAAQTGQTMLAVPIIQTGAVPASPESSPESGALAASAPAASVVPSEADPSAIEPSGAERSKTERSETEVSIPDSNGLLVSGVTLASDPQPQAIEDASSAPIKTSLRVMKSAFRKRRPTRDRAQSKLM